MAKYRYVNKNGQVYQSIELSELVSEMRDLGKFTADESVEDFMKGFAERFKIQEGKAIRYDSPENFVNDLVICGWLKMKMFRKNL